LKVLLGAFGDPGHAFPMLALGEALVARGHSVALQTWRRWEPDAVAAGMEFAAAPEYQVFPTRERPLKPYEAAVRAAEETRPVIRSFAPDVAVSDILTPAPALAAELEGVPVATLVPHVYPDLAPGFPPSYGESIHFHSGYPYVPAQLEAGMVLSIEPPIFLHEERLGVRLLDDLLVTETGAEILSSYPRDLLVVG